MKTLSTFQFSTDLVELSPENKNIQLFFKRNKDKIPSCGMYSYFEMEQEEFESLPFEEVAKVAIEKFAIDINFYDFFTKDEETLFMLNLESQEKEYYVLTIDLINNIISYILLDLQVPRVFQYSFVKEIKHQLFDKSKNIK